MALHARDPADPVEDGPAPDSLRPLLWGLAVIVLATMAAFGGLASVVNLGLPVAALAVSVYLLVRGRHIAYVHVVLALWLFGAGVRRVVDWQTTFHASSPVLLAAPVASVVGVFFCAVRRTRLPTAYVGLLALFGLVLGYALVTGVLVSGPLPALVSFSAWAPPFLLGAYVAFFPGSARELGEHLARTSWTYLTALGGYGILQWVVAPAWDTAWMQAIYSPGFSFGDPEPFGIRVFSLLNAPYPLGCALVVLIASQVACPLTAPRLVSLVLGIGSLALGGVRAAWLVLALVLALLAVRGRLRPWVGLAGAAAVGAGVAFAPASFTETVGDRLGTLTSGSSDVSYAARDEFYSTVLPQLFGDPTGRGFGSTGAGVRASGSGADATFQNVDSTYIDALRTFGPVFGVLVLALSIGLVLWFWFRMGGARGPFSAWTSFLAAVPILAALGDVFGGSTGALFWVMMSLCAHRGVQGSPPERGGHEHVDAGMQEWTVGRHLR